MVHGAHVNDKSRAGRGESDAGDYGRRIRGFAQDAHRILKSPDSQLDELIELHGRVFDLLNEAPGADRAESADGSCRCGRRSASGSSPGRWRNWSLWWLEGHPLAYSGRCTSGQSMLKVAMGRRRPWWPRLGCGPRGLR